MKYGQIQGLEDDKFRRLTGVKRTSFEKMICILTDANIPMITESACIS